MKSTEPTKFCKDCGHNRPIADFYQIRDGRLDGAVRPSTYCREHTKVRNMAATRNAPEGSGLRESARRASRKYAAAHKEAIRERVARYRARKKADPPA
jgi:hypothetical protein